MAPIKFEENIKEKLEERTLEPSGQAWNKLSDKLDTDFKQSSNKTFLWIGVAASLVGILLTLNVLFKTSETHNQNPVLVDTEAKDVEKSENINTIKSKESVVTLEESGIKNETLTEGKLKSSKTRKNAHIHTIKNTAITQVEAYQKNEETGDNLNVESSSEKIEIALLENQDEESKTDTEIDALLKKAQQNLTKNHANRSYAIDAHSLLQDVEEDLDESFRDKVFETLKTSYKKVKTAVAERND